MGVLFLLGVVLISGGGVTMAHAESVVWSKTIAEQLQNGYRNLRFADGSRPALAGHSGHVYMDGTHVSVAYNVRVTDTATGAVLSPGAQVSESAQLLFEFVPHVYTDISWFTTGGTQGSPYGDWIGNAQPPPIACIAKDYVFSGEDWGEVKHYVVLSVDPPVKSISAPAGMACDASSGSNQTCTFTQAGTYTPQFDFAPTSGKFYYRVTEPRFSRNQCAGDNIASMTNASSQPYTLAVPVQTIPFPITVLPSDQEPEIYAPTTPTLTSSGACVVGEAHIVNFVSTDPNGDNLRYGIDWDADGSTDQYVPGSGYVASGSTQTASRTYSVAGSKTVKVIAQDDKGRSSSWASITFSCADSAIAGLNENGTGGDNQNGGGITTPTAAILDLRVIPSLVRSGNTTKVNWSATNVQSCTVSAPNGDGWNGILSAIGGEISKPITGETVYTLSCIDLKDIVKTKTATVKIIPTFKEI